MKILFICLLLGAALSSVRAETNPYRYPVRVVNDGRVNLLPLFTWWSNATHVANLDEKNASLKEPTNAVNVLATRPLSRWVRIKADKWQPSTLGWTMEANVERSPGLSMNMTIVLKHPPMADKARFDSLVARRDWLVGYDKQQTQVAGAKRNNAHALGASSTSYKHVANAGVHGYYKDSLRGSADEQWNALLRASQESKLPSRRAVNTTTERENVNRRLAEFNMGSGYEIDLFALFTGQYQNGMPVLDLGNLY